MPVLLFWYILRDLLKLLVISTAVLVTIISFGAAIRPLGDGDLRPMQILEFILLAMPPMLQFALPFSAAFSATLVYHRMSSDNEVAACASSGVPYSRLLLPAAALGVVLTIGLSFLANYISPRFWELMDRAIHVDAAEALVRSVERGEPIRAGDTLIHAEAARKIDPPEGSDAYAALYLRGLLVVNHESGLLESSVTGRQAALTLTRRRHYTIINANIEDVVVASARGGLQPQMGGFRTGEYAIPDSFHDQPKFMDVSRLKSVARSPWLYWKVDEEISKLRRWLVVRQLHEEIDARLRTTGRIELDFMRADAEGRGGSRYVLIAGGLGPPGNEIWPVLSPTDGSEARVIAYRRGRAVAELRSREVIMEPIVSALPTAPRISIVLKNATASDLEAAPPLVNTRPIAELTELRPETSVVDRIESLSLGDLGQVAMEYEDETPNRLLRRIDSEIAELHSVILARLHERAALSVSCVVMMMLGATLGIYLRGALPLTVYFYSFIPAIIGLVLISAGADVVRNVEGGRPWGLVVMWSGNFVMAAFSLFVLRKQMRN
ncbi:MAG: LptF/LptG family permease [Phycisphaerales bacterium]